MRTEGTFNDVYEAAKNYLDDDICRDDCPIEPVVRRENGVWMLESDLSPTNCDMSIPLDDFHAYWSEAMEDDDYTPSEREISDYILVVSENAYDED